jgi:hypothetical protein
MGVNEEDEACADDKTPGSDKDGKRNGRYDDS